MMKSIIIDILLISFLLILLIPSCMSRQVIYVAQDGSGTYKTIGAAIQAAPENSVSRVTIKVKPGIYRENIVVPITKTMLTIVGYGMDRTIVTGNRSNGTGFGTDKTATADIYGDGFCAINITFENTAGPSGGQAVALKTEVMSSFYLCRFLGYQDTLYAKQKRQFYRDCQVYGTVDFIFGDASAVFQNCIIVARKSLPGKSNTITAQSRSSPTSKGGYVFQNCVIKGAPDLPPTFKTYFGRPWRIYARVIIMQSEIGKVIDPLGWSPWDQTGPVDKLFYAEFRNRGPGAKTSGRVKWPGLKLLNRTVDVSTFTVRNFIRGNRWIPRGIPYYLDL